uniref:Uncharacterized protein n=1 Tax=Romanomermis culicivorax TaxID=13658 RepID=A0A915KWI5_ROMCU
MTSLDLIDSVLRIGDNGLGNGLFVAGFEDFYQRQFSPSGIRFNGAQFLYMLYGAILSLPLTEKITKHNIDGLLVAKKGNNLKLMVSYATLDNSLSLKLIHFDASLRPSIPTTEQSIVLDARKHLTSIKNRHIDLGELKSALKETHEVTFTYKIDHGPVTVIPKLSKSPCDIDRALMSPFFKFTELALVQENQRAESASSFVKQLQSDVYDVVKYNSHAFTRLLIMQHQIMASDMRLQLSLNYDYMYLFLIGAMEINWARSYRLIIRPIFETSGRAIQGLMISHAPFKKSWKSESTPFVVKLLTSTLSPHTKDYNDDMYNKIVDGLPYTQTEKVIVVGIEHNKLIEAFKKPMDVPSFQLLPYTYLLDMNPMENLVDILLQPYTDSTLSKINFCIKNLNQKGKYGLHTYLYGQLMSFKKYDIEKYIFHDSNLKQGRTTFVFKLRGTDTGVLFDIFQTSPLLQIRDDILSNFEGHSLPTHLLNIKHLLRIAVHQIHEMMDGRTERVRLTRSYAHFLDAVQLQQRQVLLGNWLPVPTMSPEYVLANIERRIEAYKDLDTLDILHVMLDSIDTNLLQFRDKVSIEDIVHFMSGLYSDWNRIFYHGFLGILKSDGTPLFISSLETSGIYQQHLVTAKLREISAKYIRFDYIPNPLRRIANFVCITRNSQNENKISIARLSTFQEHKAAFESCLAHNMVRMKRRSLVRIPCIADEVPEHTNEALGDDGKLPSLSESDKLKRENPIRTLKTIKMKISPHLETVNKVSKVIMTAQMFKDMVGALIRGDYKTFAVNTAFLASGPLLECLSMKMIAKGASIGDSLLGRSLLISAPFMGRLPIMGFVGFDLYEQVKSYKNGDKGAMVNIMGDSSILTIDFATASVEGAEALGVISGVADIAGPIGFAIGTAIFVGVDIYNSVKAVSNIDAMVHLTSWQKFTTGFLSFLHVSPTKTVQKELFEKNAADASIENAANFFKNHPSVKYYLFPSYQDNGKFVENNIIDLRTNVTRIAHSWPKDIANTKLICAGNSKLPVYKTSRLLLNCSNSFGYESTYNILDRKWS